MVATSRRSLRVAVLLEAVQFSDIVGADILGNLSTESYQALSPFDPTLAPFAEDALDIEFFYLAETLEPTNTFGGGLRYLPNVTYDACPRDLDIVLIGGPLPTHRPVAADTFLKEAWKSTPVFMTTCTGGLWLASTGLLNGRKATTNRYALEIARQYHPEVEWVDQRWVVESKPCSATESKGELWTAGGAASGVKGIDMMAAYCLQNFNPDYVRAMALRNMEFEPEDCRGQFYTRKI